MIDFSLQNILITPKLKKRISNCVVLLEPLFFSPDTLRKIKSSILNINPRKNNLKIKIQSLLTPKKKNLNKNTKLKKNFQKAFK